MKIAIMGTGGVGGYFGARLAAAGADVHFIARGAHLSAIRHEGLRVISALGNQHLRSAQATDRPAEVGPCSLVLVAVKLWSTVEALEAARPLVGPDTAVLSFQNGVEAIPAIDQAYGPGHALGGVAHIAAAIESPGTIRHNGTMAKLAFGEPDGSPSHRTEVFLAACEAGGIEASRPPDIRRALWEKFVFIAGLSGATAVTRLPIGPILADSETRAMLREIMEEAAAVGRASGVPLDADCARAQLAFMDTLPAGMISSMLGDLRRGQRLELPWLAGAVVRLGRDLDLPTPVNRLVLAALRLHANGRPPEG